MASEWHSKIDEIFNVALDLPLSEREAYLDKECKGDPELKKEINSLLSFESISGHFLDETPDAVAAEMFTDARPPESLIGRRLGHYSIVKILGIGGMGEVYLAEDTRLGRKVALKLLPDLFAGDRERLTRFTLEARSASTLNHPSIITIHEIDEADGVHFMATEFIDGQTLKVVLGQAPMNLGMALDIGIQVASALAAAHSAGIVHRDIKPDNIMLRPDGLVKILDFGVAKFAETELAKTDPPEIRERNSADTLPGMIIGTAEYMSPEQARGVSVDHRSDIFSFGVLMYEILTGIKPFVGKNSMDTIGAVLHKEAEPIGQLAPELPASVAAIVDKCLSKSAEHRPQQIKEVLEVLRRAKRQLDHDSGEAGSDESHTTQKIVLQAEPTFIETKPFGMFRGIRGKAVLLAVTTFSLVLAFIGYYAYYSSPAEKQITSIAVMPFVNQSGDVAVDFLSDGVTENLISSLSTIPGLSVKARSTVFTFKGKQLSPKAIGQELNVDAVVFGTLVQKGDDIRIAVELVDTSTQNILWTQSYSRKLPDLVPLQREVARDISDQLRSKLSPTEQKSLTQSYPTNSEAQQLYLKGRFHWNKRTSADLEKAAEFFSQAIEKDPEFALAHSGLANAYALTPIYGPYRPSDFVSKAKQAAIRSLELDPDLAEGHASLGFILQTYDFDWPGAEREFKTAIRLNPNYATAHQWYAEHLAFKGSTNEALTRISEALEIDPFSLVINRMKGNVLSFSNRHDEALVQFSKTLELYPNNASVMFNIGDTLAAKGMRNEAVQQYLIALELSGLEAKKINELRDASRDRGWYGFWNTYLKQLLKAREEKIGADQNAYIENESLALAYAATGNKDLAIEYLDRAFAERDPRLVTIRMTQIYESLNDDPRYHELLKKIGL